MLFFALALVPTGVKCVRDCLLDYNGKTSVTSDGIECQKWNSEYPHVPKYQPKVCKEYFKKIY